MVIGTGSNPVLITTTHLLLMGRKNKILDFLMLTNRLTARKDGYIGK